MSGHRLGTGRRLVILVVGMAMLAGIVGIQSELSPLNAASRKQAIRYVPSREVLRLGSFGYDTVYADLLWVRGIQYLATPFEDPDAKYDWLESLFQGITDLDPEFVAAYRLGSTWLTLIKKDGEAGVRLLEKGMQENADRWELPHDLAMIHYVDRRDRTAAMESLKKAIEIPDCPLHVRTFAQFLMVEKDEAWGAIAMWLRYIEQNENEIVRDVARENICKIQCAMLRRGLETFHEKAGRNPASLKELLASGVVSLREGFDVLDGIAYEPEEGRIWSPELERLQESKHRYLLETAIRLYREQTGEAPTNIRDLRKVLYRIPRHPRWREGLVYALDPETLEIVARRVETAK